MDVLGWFVLLLAVAFVNSLLSVFGIKKFLSAHSVIDGPQALEGFKQMVRRQMYQALVQMVFLIAANIFALYGILTRQINLLIVIALNGIVIILSKFMKGFEEKSRNLEVSGENLKSEYEDICATWIEKPFPDF